MVRHDKLLKNIVDSKNLDKIDEQDRLAISDLDYYLGKIENDLNNNPWSCRITMGKNISSI